MCEPTLDSVSLTASIGGRTAKLTKREFAVLGMLERARGETVPHATLLSVWGEHAPMPNLRVAIRGLRHKLERDPELPALILSDPGRGYRLARG